MKNTQKIRKNKEIIKHALQRMPATDRLFLNYLFTLVKPDQKDLTVVFHTASFLAARGERFSEKNYERVMSTLKNIVDKSTFIRQSDGNLFLFRWVDTLVEKPNKLHPDLPDFNIKFSPDLKAYLFK